MAENIYPDIASDESVQNGEPDGDDLYAPRHHHNAYANTQASHRGSFISFFIGGLLIPALIYFIGHSHSSNSSQSQFRDPVHDLLNDFNSSFVKVSTLPDTLHDFSKDIWNTTKLVTDSKFELEKILRKTNLTNQEKLQLNNFFVKVDDLLFEMCPLSNDAASHYERLSAAARTFISDTARMKRMVQRANYKGVSKAIGGFIKYIDGLGHQFITHTQEIKRYWKEARGYKQKMYLEKESISAEDIKAEFYRNNPPKFNPLGFIFRQNDDTPNFEEQANERRDRFKAAEDKFDIIAQCLDDSVYTIEEMKKNISGIGTGLRVVNLNLKKMVSDVVNVRFNRYEEQIQQTLDNVIERLEESEARLRIAGR